MVENLNAAWLNLIGPSAQFSLERRIFHSISIGVIVLSAVYIPYNFFAGLYIASVSALILSLFFIYEYYNSRYKDIPHGTVQFAVIGLVIFSVNYFANSGISGSTDVIWPAYLLLLFAISPYRQHWVWLIVYLIVFEVLHVYAYYHPEMVKYPFTEGKGELVDRATAFPLPVITIYIVIKYMRKSYDKERTVADDRAKAVETQNRHILFQKQQIEKSDNEKNKLMSIISHDMRAPLINVQSYLQLLSENEIDVADRAEIERNLLTATNSTMDMLTNLLQWSKSQMEGPAVNLTQIDLLITLHNTLEMCRMHAEKKGIVLTYDIPANLTVVADNDMLQLVVRNLVSNAIKFTPGGGGIKVTAQPAGNECKITVADNGKGIAYNKQQNIFTVNTSPDYGTNNEKGVGLGLTLCKEFIERQNGRIAFESAPGEGSKFFVWVDVG